jgi:hypothetical protein
MLFRDKGVRAYLSGAAMSNLCGSANGMWQAGEVTSEGDAPISYRLAYGASET